MEFTSELADAARESRAWPFEEARKLVARVERTGQKSVLFETGYGPSGLPHIGTFGEVARTGMVRLAFRALTENKIDTRLLAFSDDMDGLRKVPENVPNRAAMEAHLGKPLSRVPDPFEGSGVSFGAANNARLRAFLDRFGFDYEFASSTDYYASGRFDATLLTMLGAYDAVMEIILPTLGPERRATYSPFLPVSPTSGKVLQVPMVARDLGAGTVTYVDPDTGARVMTPVTGGAVKCQWKADWALRWVALGVDYEMAGKDLIESVKLSGRIAKALGGTPPEGFNYELFLDESGQKISKSKGNGLTIEEWLRFADPETLALFMFQKPTAAKRLHFDVIPRAAEDHQAALGAFPKQGLRERLGNPAWHIHGGAPPAAEVIEAHGMAEPLPSFTMLLNLAAVANSEDPAVLWGFLRRYAPHASPAANPALDRMVRYAIAYYAQEIAPKKRYVAPDVVERETLGKLRDLLAATPEDANAAEVQTALYDLARAVPRYQDLAAKSATPERPGVSNEFFNMLYRTLLGEERGPRFGSFVALFGPGRTKALVEKALAGELASAN